MRQKELKLVTTFHTTADALGCEKACKANGIEGRIIPVPRQLSSGCGLAWCCGKDKEDELRAFLTENKVEFEQMKIILF